MTSSWTARTMSLAERPATAASASASRSSKNDRSELRASVTPILKGDTLILTTDGVSDGFSDEISINDPAQKIADRILSTHNKGTDDAMVLVAQFLAETI